MVRLLCLAALAAPVAAFVPAGRTSSTTSLNAMSKSVPFLEAPKNTKGWVGDVEFDPLSLSDNWDMKWMRESEIKHGRSCMLACLGFVVQEYYTLPGYEHVADSNLAPSIVGFGPMAQFVFYCGILEWWMNKGNITTENMFSDPDRVPGVFGFDPFGLYPKDAAGQEKMQLQEIKNGRLAMLAIGGMIHHNWVTGEPLF